MLMQEERELVVEYGKKMSAARLSTGTSGNISIYNAEQGLVAISPSGMDYFSTTPEDVVILDLDGKVVDGKRKPSSEWALHTTFYKHKPHARAVVHTHSVYCTTLAVLGEPIRAVHYVIGDAGAAEVPCAPYQLFGTEALAEAAMEVCGKSDGVLLGNHGLVCCGKDIKGATVCVSGAGNVAIYATEKATELGAKVVTMADSTGWIYDAEGIDLDAIKEIKEVKRQRLTEYKNYRPNSEYHEGKFDWSVKCDVALPCATQNELNEEDAKRLIANGCYAVAEGANMPTTLEATKLLQKSGILFAPGKAANAGGVATSALEMSQNSQRLSWTFEEVDAKLKNIMVNIYKNISAAAKKYGHEGDYVVGANIAGFEKVADSMIQQGVC